MKRKLTVDEKQAVISLLSGFENSVLEQILLDLNASFVEAVTSDGSRLQFEIPGYDRPPYQGQHSVGGEGLLKDDDGVDVDVNLYADVNNRILEIEFIKWADKPLIAPNWKTFQRQF